MGRRITTLLSMAALLTACVSVSAQSFSGGSGTQFDPYLISNADDLDALNEATNNEFENMTEGRYYQLTADITTPYTGMIGTEGVFHGNFDGNGHCITLDIERYESYVGLFGTTSRATIRNLQVDGSVFAQHYVGAIVGNPSNGTLIENCINYASVTGSTRVGGIAGGIVSVSQGGNVGATVRNCVNCGTVSGKDIVGGVIGYSGQQVGNSLCRLVNYGHVDAPVRSGDERLGGVIGNPLFDDVVVALLNFGTTSNRTVAGCMGNANPESQSLLFYDCQMSPSDYVFPTQEVLTREILGNALEQYADAEDMSSTYWRYEDNMLPRLKMDGLELTDRAILYATPVVLDDNDQIDNISHHFKVGTENGVSWASQNGRVVFSSDGTASIVSDGDDIITARLGNCERQIAVSINNSATAIESASHVENVQQHCYTLSGMRVDGKKALPKGIYIVNGRKIVR